MTEESGGIGLTQKAIHPNVFRLNPDRLCEIAEEMQRAILDGVATWGHGPLADDVSLVIAEVR
jgi:hypothetical protein